PLVPAQWGHCSFWVREQCRHCRARRKYARPWATGLISRPGHAPARPCPTRAVSCTTPLNLKTRVVMREMYVCPPDGQSGCRRPKVCKPEHRVQAWAAVFAPSTNRQPKEVGNARFAMYQNRAGGTRQIVSGAVLPLEFAARLSRHQAFWACVPRSAPSLECESSRDRWCSRRCETV